MRKKSLLAITVILLLAVGMAAMSVSSAAAPSSARQRGWAKPSASNAAAAVAAAKTKDVTRLVLIARFVEETLVDVPPVGEENVGDSFLFTEDLFTPTGRAVGHDQVRCTLMFRQEVFCEASAVLNGRDEIVVEGVIGAEQRPVLAVVGGTGRFRNARGQVFILPGPTEEETRLVFALLL
jgi:aminoglycoside/choline kinase family phosphotransferase